MRKIIIIIGIILHFILLFSTYSFPEEYKIPIRSNDNLVIASYNIKFFGQTKHDINKIALIIKYFDICGILEIKNEDCLIELKSSLENITKEKWNYVFGMNTTNPHGKYYESYAFIYRKNKVEIGNGIISNLWDFKEVYRNDPFVCSFQWDNFSFVLFLIHTRWSNDIDGNLSKEILMIPEYIDQLKDFIKIKDIILLGDFNEEVDNIDIKIMIKKTKMIQVDPNLNTTFKTDCSNYSNSYDHIFITKKIKDKYIESSVIDTTKEIYGDNPIENMRLSNKELSDHLPVWIIIKK